jgi:hypothetical protein
LDQLAKDPIRFAVVIGALYPDMMREMIEGQRLARIREVTDFRVFSGQSAQEAAEIAR